YFDKQAQENATIQAGYAPEKRKFYLADLDVERRETQAGGEWSEWATVVGSKAMPEFTIPTPIMRDNGLLANEKELRAAWNLVKHEQDEIMQPPFYEVVAGDKWQLPQKNAPQPAFTKPHQDPLQRIEVQKDDTIRPPDGTRAPKQGTVHQNVRQL